jgi:hypothetical protein
LKNVCQLASADCGWQDCQTHNHSCCQHHQSALPLTSLCQLMVQQFISRIINLHLSSTLTVAGVRLATSTCKITSDNVNLVCSASNTIIWAGHHFQFLNLKVKILSIFDFWSLVLGQSFTVKASHLHQNYSNFSILIFQAIV